MDYQLNGYCTRCVELSKRGRISKRRIGLAKWIVIVGKDAALQCNHCRERIEELYPVDMVLPLNGRNFDVVTQNELAAC